MLDILHAIMIGILGYFISVQAINTGQIFAFYGRWLSGIYKHGGKFGKWISNPMGLCEKCCAGMISLIYFTYIDKLTDPRYIILTLSLVSISGMMAITMKKIFNE